MTDPYLLSASFADVAPATTHDVALHVAFGIDRRFMRPTGVLLASILLHSPELSFVFHILTDDVEPDDIIRLHSLESNPRCTIHIHRIHEDDCCYRQAFGKGCQYSNAIFLRLMMPRLLQPYTDRFLYLDADILCMGSLSPLQQIILDETAVFAVSDKISVATVRAKELGLPDSRYFNSGVMFVNIKAWLNLNLEERCIQFLAKSEGALPMPDQDALNVVLNGAWKALPAKFNVIYEWPGCSAIRPERWKKSCDGVALMHFAGPIKPWFSWCPHESQFMYKAYQEHSPWSCVPLDKPVYYREMRLLANVFFRRWKYVSGAKWYARYLWHRQRSQHAAKSIA